MTEDDRNRPVRPSTVTMLQTWKILVVDRLLFVRYLYKDDIDRRWQNYPEAYEEGDNWRHNVYEEPED